MSTPPDGCLQRAGRQKTASGISLFLIEELGDARLHCAQLTHYIDLGRQIVEKSKAKDHIFEVAGHLIQAIPEHLFKLEKSLQAVALAADRMDYEQIKQELKPEKVEELERVLKQVRIRHVPHRSEPRLPMNPMNPTQAAESLQRIATEIRTTGKLPVARVLDLVASLEGQDRTASDLKATADVFETMGKALLTPSPEAPKRLHLAATLRKALADNLGCGDVMDASSAEDAARRSRFEKGQPADPTKNMDPAAAEEWKAKNEEFGDKFEKKTASNLTPTIQDIYLYAKSLLGIDPGEPGKESREFYSMLANLFGAEMLLFKRMGERELAQRTDRVYDLLTDYLGWQDPQQYGDKAAGELDNPMSRHEEGKPADPTKDMSPEDAKEWKLNTLKHKDDFKEASASPSVLRTIARTMSMITKDLVTSSAFTRFSFYVTVGDLIHTEANLLRKMGEPDLARLMLRIADLLTERTAPLMKEQGWPTPDPELESVYASEDWKSKEAIFRGSPALFLNQVEAAKDTLRTTRMLVSQVWETLGELARDATGTTPFSDIYEDPDIRRVEKTLYNLDHAMGPGIDGVEFILKVLKKKLKFAGMLDNPMARHEEGKPADPTEDMSPEDAAEWKKNTEQYGDKFKSAALDPGPMPRMELIKTDSLIAYRKGVSGNWRMSLMMLTGVVEAIGALLNELGGGTDGMGKATILNREIVKVRRGLRPSDLEEMGLTASDEDEHLSRHEEGKPADPTKDMSPEDAKEWKLNTLKHKDDFKKEASDKEASWKVTAKLQSRQEKILKQYLDSAGSRAVMDYDALPSNVKESLQKVKDQETLPSDVDRWLMDNNNPHLKSASWKVGAAAPLDILREVITEASSLARS